MCTSDFANMFTSTASATTGSGAPYAFGSSAPAASGWSQGATTLALGGISGALKMSSAMSASANAATADNAQADAAQTNALIAERAAASAIVSGQEQVSNTEIRGAQVGAAQRAAMAANGVDVNAPGTAANVQASTKWQTTQDVNTITANAARTAMGYQQQETNAINQAGALRSAADRNSPAMTGFTSLLGSATSVASDWYRNQRVGVK